VKTHFAWRPHLDRDALFNPFIPSERQTTLGRVDLSEAYGDDTETTQERAAEPIPPIESPPETKTE
jgi:hypothetical protein